MASPVATVMRLPTLKGCPAVTVRLTTLLVSEREVTATGSVAVWVAVDPDGATVVATSG